MNKEGFENEDEPISWCISRYTDAKSKEIGEFLQPYKELLELYKTIDLSRIFG